MPEDMRPSKRSGLRAKLSARSCTDAIELRHFRGHVQHHAGLSRLRIAHLTDQHVGRVTPERVQRAAVDLCNAQCPDLVVLTGDFVCHGRSHLDQLEDLLGGFDAPVLCVLGNHDHWAGAEAVRASLRRAGAEVLDNCHTVLEFGSQRLQIVGLDDAYTGHADRIRALRGLRRDLPTVGLSHIAEEADGLWAGGVPLVFSGHTHAGQVTLAGFNELTLGRLFGHRYGHGLYGCRRGQSQAGAVYVGAGIGAAVMPLRLGERGRREVAIFDLGRDVGPVAEPHTEQRPHPGRAPSARTIARRGRQLQRRRRAHERRAGAPEPERPDKARLSD